MTALISGRVTRTAADLANIRQFPSANAPDVGDLRVGDAVQFDPTPVVGGFYFVLGARFNTWLRLANGYVAERIVTLTADSAVPTPTPTPPAYLNGVDVSAAQTPLQWDVLKANGYSFAFIRATQGTREKDTAFHMHIDAALAAGFRVGVYHAVIGSLNGRAQADFFHATVYPYLDRLSFPLALDIELDNGVKPDALAQRVYDAASGVEALTGDKPLVYTAPGWWDGHIGAAFDTYFATLPLWVAHWGDMAAPLLPRPWRAARKDWTIWQWRVAENGIPGYSKRIDVNRAKP